jgi:hypothetical protein
METIPDDERAKLAALLRWATEAAAHGWALLLPRSEPEPPTKLVEGER